MMLFIPIVDSAYGEKRRHQFISYCFSGATGAQTLILNLNGTTLLGS